MKKRFFAAFAGLSLLLNGCAGTADNMAAEAPEDIAEQTASAETDSGEADETTTTAEAEGSWVLDLMEGIFGYNSHEPVPPPSGSVSPEQQKKPSETLPPPDLTETYRLTLDETGLVTRTDGIYDDNLTWVIEVNGRIQLERNAVNEMTYRPMDYGPGTYRVWLEAWVQGYQPVSNTVEFEGPPVGFIADNDREEIEGFESWRIADHKGHMKHLIQQLHGFYGDPEYKMGFIIDPDHDGTCNGVVYCAGVGDDGEPVQYIYENMSDAIRFSNADYLEKQGIRCTLGIWCDPETETDYIVRLEPDGSAYDCVTEQPVKNFEMNENLFIYTTVDESDRDHFYVSYRGVPEFEGA
ncbi:MAG: hypothetical protein IKQ91_10655 [Oscillospiraceae bacterium]|nr:hypothetical protein [Oscillospiraceae bacterium]